MYIISLYKTIHSYMIDGIHQQTSPGKPEYDKFQTRCRADITCKIQGDESTIEHHLSIRYLAQSRSCTNLKVGTQLLSYGHWGIIPRILIRVFIQIWKYCGWKKCCTSLQMVYSTIISFLSVLHRTPIGSNQCRNSQPSI